MTKKEETIDLDNIAGIHHLSIKVPASGGVVVLLGPNGSGKSNALDAIDSLVTKRGRPRTRDGAAASEVSGFGAVLHMGRKLSRLGELEVSALEGLNIADIVNPQLQDPAAADAKRIKALLKLTDAKASPELFYPLLNSQEEFETHVSMGALASDDLVTMAASIKRDLEKAARTAEASAEKMLAQAEACRLSAGDIDTSQPDDENILAAEYEEATRHQSRILSEAEAHTVALVKQQDAQTKLQLIQTGYTGLTPAEANIKLGEAERLEVDARSRVIDLEAELAVAKQDLSDRQAKKGSAHNTLIEAETYWNTTRAWQETIDAALPRSVAPDELTEAAERLEKTRQAATTGALIRKAKKDLATSLDLKKTGREAEKEAARLREAAKCTENVLSAAVESLGVPLKVQDNRLVTPAPGRLGGQEVFDDLSDGQKWKLVCDIAVKAVGPGGMVVLPQGAWQDLDDTNKRIVAEAVENTGVVIVTARQDAGHPQLTAETYELYSMVEE